MKLQDNIFLFPLNCLHHESAQKLKVTLQDQLVFIQNNNLTAI